jgi:L-alanine-DL-glutamate epimerase-like enolase superfamily enzyme
MFLELMDRGKIDVVQPDITRAGGFTECKRIANLANDRGLLCIPHIYKTGIGIAATLHLSAAIPNSPFVEFPPSSSFSKDSLRNRVTNEDFALGQDGTIELPSKPGLGVTLNEDAVEKYRYNG